jgi:hypothetical protein
MLTSQGIDRDRSTLAFWVGYAAAELMPAYERLKNLLANYRGVVQCDGYAPYKKLPADRITVAFCWSHLRRATASLAMGASLGDLEELVNPR